SELLSGLDEAAQEDNRFLVISTSHRRSADFKRAAQAFNKRDVSSYSGPLLYASASVAGAGQRGAPAQ
ncbi:MAG: hypothetical protein ACK41D_11615, partial [Rubricoccaceae bacterium]